MLSEIAPGSDRLSCLVPSSVRSAPFAEQRRARGRARAMTVGVMLQRRCHLGAWQSLRRPARHAGSYARIAAEPATWAHLARKRAHASVLSPQCPARGGGE